MEFNISPNQCPKWHRLIEHVCSRESTRMYLVIYQIAMLRNIGGQIMEDKLQMSLFIRNCQSSRDIHGLDHTFRPFSRERTHIGRIIRPKTSNIHITSQEVFKTLKIPDDQYKISKVITQCQHRFRVLKREYDPFESVGRRIDNHLKSIDDRICKVDAEDNSQKSYYERMEETSSKLDEIRKKLIEGKCRQWQQKASKANKKQKLQEDELALSVVQCLRKVGSKAKVSQLQSKSKGRLGSEGGMYEVRKHSVFRGYTFQHKILKRPLFKLKSSLVR